MRRDVLLKIMDMFKRSILILPIVLILSCGFENLEGEPQAEVPFSTLAYGDSISSDFEITTYTEMVIDNEQEWSALLALIGKSTRLEFVITQTEVDFNNFTVIAVFDKTWLSGGHTIDITDVNKQGNQLVVTVDRLGKGTITSNIQQPYHMVKINRTNQEIVFDRRF